jgi:hypothetical protein
MASNAVKSAVKARLGSSWTSIDGTVIPVLIPNTDGEMPPVPNIQVQYPVGTEQHVGMAGIGNRTFREDGAIRIILTIARGQGEDQAGGWMDELRTLFRAVQFGGVSTFSASPTINNDNNDLSGYWLLSFSVPYYFYVLA